MPNMASVASALVGFLVFFWIIMLGVSVLMIIASWKLFEKAGEPGWAIFVPFYNSYVMFKISWGNGWYFLLSAVPALVYLGAYFSLIFSAIGAGITGYDSGNIDTFAIMSYFSSYVFLMIIVWIMMLVINIITYVKLAKVFGQGGGFACGLIFLYPIFLCIMAFSKDIQYVGIPGKMPPHNTGYGTQSQQNQAPNWQNPYYQSDGYQQTPPPQYGPSQGWGWQSPTEPQNNPSGSASSEAAPQPEDAKYCPDCGMTMKKDDKFCPRCGKPQ